MGINKMKINALRIILFLCFLGLFSFSYAGALDPSATVINYFDALKSGNVEGIKSSVAGEFYEEQKVLLEQNPQYPAFLRKNYGNAAFRLENTYQPSADRAVINVTIYFADGSESPTVFHLERASTDYTWRIVKEVVNF
jgi:hypothetical protein